MLNIVNIDTPSLGDRSYLVHDGVVALVVDPQRDIDRVLDLVKAEGIRVTHIVETHLHNDYVTGGLALAKATDAAYLVAGAEEVSFDRVPVAPGDEIAIGDGWGVRAVATPGHTYNHLSYVLVEDGAAVGVFTGGSLLHGSTGRPDLLGPEDTDALARHQYASAHVLVAQLPDEADLYPTHGFGSFCSATQSVAFSSTVGQEKKTNPALTHSEADYVAELLAGLDEWPAYYSHMGALNAAGPSASRIWPPVRADKETLRRRIEAGEWVIDLRDLTSFAAGFARGTVNYGVDGLLATYVGWTIPWGAPLTLLGETPEQVAEAQRELSRVGIDHVAGSATGGPEDWTDQPLGAYRVATFAELADVLPDRPVAVLDVRRNLEYAESHIDGAMQIPVHDLLARQVEVPAGEVWVHCETGYRAAIGASLLAAHDREVVVIDDVYDNVYGTDLRTVETETVAGGPEVAPCEPTAATTHGEPVLVDGRDRD